MRRFHELTVAAVDAAASDAVRVVLDVPEALNDEFRFLAGQHLPVRRNVDGQNLRRTYSICSAPGRFPLQLGVRVQPGGAFSGWLATELKAGDTLDVMPPFGQFHANVDPDRGSDYLGFASGSGITPILSIMTSILETEPRSRFALFYGNRRQSTTMFIDELYALKNRFPDRLQLHFLFSREQQEFAIAEGRLDADKVRRLLRDLCGGLRPTEAFVCGPDSMIDEVGTALAEAGIAEVHSERFGVPRQAAAAKPQPVARDDEAEVTVILDGHRKQFAMAPDADNIVDAAAANGIDLPYSCKGGVCATCRTFVREGSVDMATNYGLEPWEVEKGFVLACQSRPTSSTVVLDYDET